MTYYSLLRKAWEIVGYTTEAGNVYCADCGDSGDASLHGSPVFVSDEYDGLTCDSCQSVIR